MMKELKLGENLLIKCVEDQDRVGGCIGCVFNGCETMCAKLACYDVERTDGRNVHFEME